MFLSDEDDLNELENSLDDQLSTLDVLLEQLPAVQTGQSYVCCAALLVWEPAVSCGRIDV